MRLFITSYQKSGTHQIMPMFSDPIVNVVDRSHGGWLNAPKRYGFIGEINWEGVVEVILNLVRYPDGRDKAFGHLSYMKEFAKIFAFTNVKVLFNIRDPRDVIVSEYENAQRHFREHKVGFPLYHFLDTEDNTHLFDKPDPISELIILAAARWPRWIGWMDHAFVMPVKYEELRLNQKETLLKIIDFMLPYHCPDISTMMQRAVPTPQNPTFRRGVPGEWKEKFKPHHVEMAEEMLGDVIGKLGYKL